MEPGWWEAVLRGEEFRRQVGEWRKQREILRNNLRQLHSTLGDDFLSWWASPATSPEERQAAVLAALEDVQGPLPEILGSLAGLLFPELQTFLEGEGDLGSFLGQLVSSNRREIVSEVWDTSGIPKEACEPLIVARSCIALQFFCTLLILFMSIHGDGGASAGGDGASDSGLGGAGGVE